MPTTDKIAFYFGPILVFIAGLGDLSVLKKEKFAIPPWPLPRFA